MATCKKIRRVDKRVCIGSLNKQIEIQLRELKEPIGASVDFDEEFTVVKTVWSMVETVGNKLFFDGTNTDQITTHNFYIRYIPSVSITSENWIKYNDELYDIVGTENLNEENRFYKLRANVRGTITKPVNFSS